MTKDRAETEEMSAPKEETESVETPTIPTKIGSRDLKELQELVQQMKNVQAVLQQKEFERAKAIMELHGMNIKYQEHLIYLKKRYGEDILVDPETGKITRKE